MNFFCTTERLILKTTTPRDLDAILDYLQRNRDFLERTEMRRDATYFSAEVQQRIISEEKEATRQGSFLKFWICTQEAPERMIGSISFMAIAWGNFQSCIIGYRLDKERQNQGYMTEAINGAIRIAYSRLNLHRIEANILPGNRASLRVAEKTGFRPSGMDQKYLLINGTWEDHVRMVHINNAWSEANHAASHGSSSLSDPTVLDAVSEKTCII